MLSYNLYMKKLLFLMIISAIIFIPGIGNSVKQPNYNEIVNNPTDYIEVVDWHFYVASRVAILYNVTLENKSPYTFKRIKVRVNYYSTNGSSAGIKIAEQKSVLDITLPPNSKNTYLKSGYPIGAGSPSFKVKNLDVISAEVVKN